MTKKKKEKIKELEERIRQLEKEKSERSIVGMVASSIIPGLGGIVRTLEKTSPEFKKRIEETEKEIKFRLERGMSSRPRIEYHFSTRPLMPEKIPRKKEEIKSIIVWEETPPVEEKDLKVYPVGKKLIIQTKDRKYRKEIPLPCYVKDLEVKYKKGKNKGILRVKMKKR